MEATPTNERRPRHRRRVRNRAQIPTFGNWDDYNDHHHHQHQIPITQYFDYCATVTKPVQLHHTLASSVYPYAQSYSPAYTAFTYGDDRHFHGDVDGVYNHNYDAVPQPQQHHFNRFNNKTTSAVAAEVKSAQTRQQRRRRSYLGVDNNSKVFDITEAVPTPTLADKCYPHNDVVSITPDLYDAGSANAVTTTGKDEDLYKIPPELLRKSKRSKKMRSFFTKCFVTICASY